MANENDRLAGRGHLAQGVEEAFRLLRGEYGGRFVEDQQVCATVEHLDDLDPLLFADR